MAAKLKISRREAGKLAKAGAPLAQGFEAVAAWLAARPRNAARNAPGRLPRLDPRDPRARSLRLRTALRRLDIALARGAALEWDNIVERVGAELAVLKSALFAIPGRMAFETIDPVSLCASLTTDDPDTWPTPHVVPPEEPEPVMDGPILPMLHPADPRAIRAATEADWLEIQVADARRNIIPLLEAVAAIRNIFNRVRERVAALQIDGRAKQAINDLLRSIVEEEESGIFAETELESRLIETVSAALRAPPLMKLPEWADTYRHLAPSASALAGPWRTSHVEVARGPMMAVTEPGVRTITIMSCTQLMKTSLLENVIGYFSHMDPCPMLAVFPKDESAVGFSKERLSPMVRVSPVLRDLIRDGRSRVSGDTLAFKSFPGGILAMVSAGSPTNLAMRAIRVALLDEVDKYEVTKEGDPVILAEERLATFNQNRLAIRACSPTWTETSRIAASYSESDQRKPFVKCPGCGEEETWDFFRNVQWQKSPDKTEHFPKTAILVCSQCGHPWTEEERLRVLTTEGEIRWKQTAPFFCCGERQTPARWIWDGDNHIGRAQCKHCEALPVNNRHAGFQCSKLYSPKISIVEIAEAFISAKDRPESKITFYNTVLGEPYNAEAEEPIEANTLAARAEDYTTEVPRDVVVMCVGADVQTGDGGRIEAELLGIGLGEETWSIDYAIFPGNPSEPDVWQRFKEFLWTPRRNELGFEIFPSAACIDSGVLPQEVYAFCAKHRNMWPVKGASERGQWGPIWPQARMGMKKWRKRGASPVRIIGVNSAKRWIQRRLAIEEPGPGYCHFPKGRPLAYFEQFGAEYETTENRHGTSYRRFKQIRGRANEALDCRVYAVAAYFALVEERGFDLARAHAKLMANLQPQQAASADGRWTYNRPSWLDGSASR